jgi:hypothetical protein
MGGSGGRDGGGGGEDGGCGGGGDGGGAGGVSIWTGPQLVQTPRDAVTDDAIALESNASSTKDRVAGEAATLTSTRTVYCVVMHVEQRLMVTPLPVAFCRSAWMSKRAALSSVRFAVMMKPDCCRRRRRVNDVVVSSTTYATVTLRDAGSALLLLVVTEQVAVMGHAMFSVLFASCPSEICGPSCTAKLIALVCTIDMVLTDCPLTASRASSMPGIVTFKTSTRSSQL